MHKRKYFSQNRRNDNLNTKKQKITVSLSSSNLYAQHTGVTITSILKNKNEDEYIKFFIFDGGISEENKNKLQSLMQHEECEITFIRPDTNILKGYSTGLSYITNETYYRLLAPQILPNEDKILHIDSDTVVMKSLITFWNKHFGSNLVLGVKDIDYILSAKRLGLDKYINAGIILLNAKKIREEGIVNKYFEWAKENVNIIERCDQDILNVVLQGRVGYVEEIYNTQVIYNSSNEFERIKNPIIIHFVSSKKPWSYLKPLNYTKFAKEYFKILKNTPWKGFYKEYCFKSTLIFPLRLLYATGIIKDMLRNIFSVYNSDDKKYKVWTILGIKIKTKRNNKKIMQGKL